MDNDNAKSHAVIAKGLELGHYRIIEKIGAGGMGEVYLASDTKLERKVALKFLSSQYVADTNIRTRFTREAQAVAKLHHPNIITIFEVAEFDDRPFFAMEYIQGKAIYHYCTEEKLSLPKIITRARIG